MNAEELIARVKSLGESLNEMSCERTHFALVSLRGVPPASLLAMCETLGLSPVRLADGFEVTYRHDRASVYVSCLVDAPHLAPAALDELRDLVKHIN